MDASSRKVLKAAGEIVRQIREDQQNILDYAEGKERTTLGEIVYDLEQAGTLISRAVNR